MNLVKKIIEEVKKNRDKAVRKYTEVFDNVKLENFEVSKKEIKEAYKKVDRKTINTIKEAAKNIEEFAKVQLRNFKDFEYTKKG